MRTRSKKTKTVNNNNDLQKSEEKQKFDQLPLDLEIEMFRRLPLKSVARFLTLSKSCATTIRSPSFITSFPSQPCTLIASAATIRTCHNLPSSFKSKDQRLYFFSSSSSSSTVFSTRLTCPLSPYDNLIEYYYHYASGLISIGCNRKQIVTNPSTGRFITLPSVRRRRVVVKSFFGYDPVSDQYKVLCMTERRHGLRQDPSSEHQVFTLGEKKPWKMIDCTSIPDHRPWSNGVCIDGFVYYVAKTGQGMSQLSLMRYALRADNLNLFTSLPEELRTLKLSGDTLLNYEGNVAWPLQLHLIFNVWVMDQDGEKHEWLKKITFNIEPWKSSSRYLDVRGTTHTGEFILAPSHYPDDEFYVFHYNLGKNSFTKKKLQVRIYNVRIVSTSSIIGLYLSFSLL
ncbi:putative F-box protein [Arabidopsis thaliana]